MPLSFLSDRPPAGPLHVVIAGGGVAALEAAVALRALVPDAVRVEVVTPQPHFTWRALEVCEPFGAVQSHGYALADLAREVGLTIRHDVVTGVDASARHVTCVSGAVVPYDVLVLAVGATPTPVVESASTLDRHAEPELFDEVIADMRADLAQELLVVVPPEVRWTLPAYELALLATAKTPAHVTLATHEPEALAVFGGEASRAVAVELDRAGITFRPGVRCDVVSAGAARIDGVWVTSDRIVALPGHTGPRIAGLATDPSGFIIADAMHRVAGTDDRVFAVGDGVAGTLKQGGLAAWAAGRVAAQIARLAGGADEPLAAPVLRGLLSTANGPLYLQAEVADPAGTSVASHNALWWPPSKVAAPWLSSLLVDLDARRVHHV